MNISARVILAIRNFFRKHGKIILIVSIIWLAIFLINMYLKLRPKKIELETSYNPDQPIMDDGESVPNNKKTDIKNIIENYFNYCNEKKYEEAYNLLTDDCKEYLYDNDISLFKEYVDSIFTNKKIYNIQNYSNLNDIYIYNIKILDDITATGTSSDYNVYQEKVAIHYEYDSPKISNQGYIAHKQIDRETENENMKVKVLKKEMSYQREEYTLEIRNKTDNYIMISDDMGSDQVTLNLGSQKRPALNTVNANIVILPGEILKVNLLFDKYYDDGVEPLEINFNLVRMLTGISTQSVNEEDKSNILRTYSMNISLK